MAQHKIAKISDIPEGQGKAIKANANFLKNNK